MPLKNHGNLSYGPWHWSIKLGFKTTEKKIHNYFKICLTIITLSEWKIKTFPNGLASCLGYSLAVSVMDDNIIVFVIPCFSCKLIPDNTVFSSLNLSHSFPMMSFPKIVWHITFHVMIDYTTELAPVSFQCLEHFGKMKLLTELT